MPRLHPQEILTSLVSGRAPASACLKMTPQVILICSLVLIKLPQMILIWNYKQKGKRILEGCRKNLKIYKGFL